MSQIIPSAYLQYCPICKASLKLSNDIGGIPTCCSQCGYEEPAGNAVVITYLSQCFTNYAHQNDIETVYLRDTEFTTQECMEGNGFLPLFVKRAIQIQNSSGLLNIPNFGLQLMVIEDAKGLLLDRVVMKEGDINIALTMSFLCEVLHETISMTQQLGSKYYESELCLDNMPSLNPSQNVPETAIAKLQQALQIATKHQIIGEKSEPK